MNPQFIKAAQAGEEVAWNILYRQHYPWMYALALRICNDNAVAKDAVQETFIAAYLKLQQLKDADAIAGWLKTILIRICRRSKQQQIRNPDDFFRCEKNGFYEDKINREIDWYSRQSKLFASFSRLPDTLQTVLFLRYFSNSLSYEEIASILCIPVGTVRSRLSQAKQKMTEQWARSSDDNDNAFRKVIEWNGLYNEYFGNVYTSLAYREKLIQHFDKNLQIIFTSGKTANGRNLVQQMIEEDMECGNNIAALEVMSSANISIVEFCNINSDEYPDRCPQSSVFVLQRTGNSVTRFTLHHSS